MYKYIEPEVAGGFGEASIIDSTVHPPIVRKLNYEFSGWLGDDILETFPCFIVTEPLKMKIESEHLSGVDFDNVIVSKSDDFLELYPDKKLPNFYWAKINGVFREDDFSMADDFRLVISEKAYQVLKFFNVGNAIFEDVSG